MSKSTELMSTATGRHGKYVGRVGTLAIALLERGAAAIRGADEQQWVEWLTPEARTTFTTPDYDNLRATFERAVAVGDHEMALRLVTSLPELLHLRIG